MLIAVYIQRLVRDPADKFAKHFKIYIAVNDTFPGSGNGSLGNDFFEGSAISIPPALKTQVRP